MSPLDDRNCRVRRAPGHLAAEVQGETMILHSCNGQYYGLNQTGTFVWEVLAAPLTIDEIIDAVQREYDADLSTLAPDVVRIVSELIESGLAEAASCS